MLLASTPLGIMLPTINGRSGCKINIGEYTIEGNLIVLDMEDFDIILGMDWLSKCHVSQVGL